MKRFDPQMGNPGPHDAKMAVLIREALEESGAPHTLVSDTEFYNMLIDNINSIFKSEIVNAKKHLEENDRYDGLA